MITNQAQVDLANQALRSLGEKPIALPFDATNPRWLLAQEFYDQVQDTTLLEHGWAFATVRTSLTVSSGPVWGWLYSYALPADYLGLQRTDQSMVVQREGTQLLGNDQPLPLTYTARVTDVSRWPAYFVSVFVGALTAAFAEQITGQMDKHKIWVELTDQRLKRAITLNDREGSPTSAQGIFGRPPGRDLVNQALRPLGDLPQAARYLLGDRFYEIVWERLLVCHFWNFATARVVLTPAVGITPTWGFTSAFALPPDYLHIQRVQTGVRYQREGAYLLADEPTVALTYTRKVTDVTQWPPYFSQCFVAALTADCAAMYPEHHKNHDAWLQIADRLLRRAKTLDGQEGSAPVLQSHDLLTARRGGWRP
jgi:hypothetical protein